jgi:hypothetical protein
LHIPKTGGRAFRETVFHQLKIDLDSKDIGLVSPIVTRGDSNAVSEAHYGWPSTINPDTYVVTLLRDPIKQSVSLFSHLYDTENNNLKKWGTKESLSDFSKVNKEEYLDYVLRTPKDNNFQFKNIISIDQNIWKMIEKFLMDEKLFNFKGGVQENKRIVNERINQCNIILDADNLTDEVMQKAYEKICSDLDINPSQLEFNNTDIFRNSTSTYIYDQLDDSEKNMLRKIFYLDYELYDNKDLFTKLYN